MKTQSRNKVSLIPGAEIERTFTTGTVKIRGFLMDHSKIIFLTSIYS